jgi:hypothetical protein
MRTLYNFLKLLRWKVVTERVGYDRDIKLQTPPMTVFTPFQSNFSLPAFALSERSPIETLNRSLPRIKRNAQASDNETSSSLTFLGLEHTPAFPIALFRFDRHGI